jgi:hypothetical protein
LQGLSGNKAKLSCSIQSTQVGVRKLEIGARWDHLRTNIVLYGALIANLGIAVAKFAPASLTGSSSMLTEGVHSLGNSGNQVLLL